MRINTSGNVSIGDTGTSDQRLRVVGVSTTASNYGLVVAQSTGNSTFIVRNDGLIIIPYLGSGTVVSSGGSLSVSSDMNLKNEDGFIENGLDKVLKLKPRYFYWKEESSLPTGIRQLGFYAQEVNEALGEEVVNTPKDEHDKWGIYDRGIIAMLTKAVQELSAKVTALEDRKSTRLNSSH